MGIFNLQLREILPISVMRDQPSSISYADTFPDGRTRLRGDPSVMGKAIITDLCRLPGSLRDRGGILYVQFPHHRRYEQQR